MEKKFFRKAVLGAAFLVMGAVGLGCIPQTGLQLRSLAASPVVAAGQAGETRQSRIEGLVLSPGQVQKEEPQMVKNGLGIVLEQLDAANDPMVDQLVVVTGTGMNSSSVKVGYYVREKNAEASEAALAESFWREEFAQRATAVMTECPGKTGGRSADTSGNLFLYSGLRQSGKSRKPSSL